MNKIVRIYKLLSDETRLRMMLLIYQDELCICQLSGILNVPQPRISKYLSKLRDLELVSNKRVGKFIYYSLNRNNKVLILNLDNILNSINEYPKILTDQKSIKHKCGYIPKSN